MFGKNTFFPSDPDSLNNLIIYFFIKNDLINIKCLVKIISVFSDSLVLVHSFLLSKKWAFIKAERTLSPHDMNRQGLPVPSTPFNHRSVSRA